MNKEQLHGFEILDFWKKLIKSRGLYMKSDHPNIFPEVNISDLKLDDSLIQMRDYSISRSFNSSSSYSMESDIESALSENTSYFDSAGKRASEKKDEQSHLDLDDEFIKHQQLDNFENVSVEDIY
jgi:hypothetical protein